MSTIFVTGGTGLTGSNVCQQLIERGDSVRALVRSASEAQQLVDLGVELMEGDIVDPGAVKAAGAGCEAVIHSAALLGGASQDLKEFHAVNVVGTANVLDASAALGMRRVVAISTSTFFDTSTGLPLEEAPILEHPPGDPYTVTKLAAYRQAHARAESGQDVVTCHPGAIFGPSPVPDRALAFTSFNRVLLAGLRGRITKYLKFPVTWVSGRDVATGAILALDKGRSNERYCLDGRPEDTVSTAEACNRACKIAGVGHRVEDIDYKDCSPELAEAFGPTLMAIATAADESPRPARSSLSLTRQRIGYQPMGLDDGLRELVSWLRALGKIA